MEAILTRRSVRRYTDEPVTEEQIEEMLRAAMAAPSAGDQRPWDFVIITERETLDAIPEFHRYAKMLHDAPLAIVVCADLDRQVHEGYWVQDCSAATENLLLAAHAIGLGAVWLGVYPREERVEGLRRLLGLPENVVPLNVVSIGHPAEERKYAKRYDESKVHRERW
jgi:nitroreductase